MNSFENLKREREEEDEISNKRYKNEQLDKQLSELLKTNLNFYDTEEPTELEEEIEIYIEEVYEEECLIEGVESITF